MALKVYLKKGTLNYKEKRLVDALQKSLQAKIDKGNFTMSEFNPPTNFDELINAHNEYCIETIEYTDIDEEQPKNADVEDEHILENEKPTNLGDTKTTVEKSTKGKIITDPFNDGEPIVRDYVTANGFKEDGNEQSTKTTFEEPENYEDSFDMPNSENEHKGSKEQSKNSEPKQPNTKVHQARPEPLNPKFDTMDNGKKKKSAKRLAKLIIGGVCLLAERGCIWWTTKDITDAKVLEYELEDTFNVNVLLALPDGKQQTVKSWFASKVKDANEVFKIGEAERDELAEDLTVLLIEKGIALNPTQEFFVNLGKTLVLDMGLKAYSMSVEINNVLTQLKVMHQEEKNLDNITHEEEEFIDNPATDDSIVEQNNSLTTT